MRSAYTAPMKTTLLSLNQIKAGCITGTNYASAELAAELSRPEYAKAGVTIKPVAGPCYCDGKAVVAEGETTHLVNVHLTTEGGYGVAFGLTKSRAQFVEWAFRSLKTPSDYMSGKSIGDDAAIALFDELADLPIDAAKASVSAACKAGYAIYNSPERIAARAQSAARREEMQAWVETGCKPSAAPLFVNLEEK